MKISLKKKLDRFLSSSKDYPLLVGFMTGFYPLVFYCSNNFEQVASIQHLMFFLSCFLIVPTITTFIFYNLFEKVEKLKPYRKHLLFIVLFEFMGIYLSLIFYFTIKKKLLLLLLILLIFASLKFCKSYKKFLIFIVFLSIIPFCKCIISLGYTFFGNSLSWTIQHDHIAKTKFIKKPNIYFIEPDGYTGIETIKEKPYSSNNDIEKWLYSNSFTTYKYTKSNYSTTLVSNASMFAMKHHFYGDNHAVSHEMENARSIVVGNNVVIDVLKKNNYKTFFIAEIDYFQQSFAKENYDYYNIKKSDISYVTSGFRGYLGKNIFQDLKNCIKDNKDNTQPKFFFIQKLLPGHIRFNGTGKVKERELYLNNIKLANLWLKKTVDLINKNDPNSIVIIASDHGGFVGLESDQQMITTKDERLLKSMYRNLIAIKWDNSKHVEYDKNLKSNINIFRILFSYLSEDKSLLKNLESDASYNLFYENYFSTKVVKVLD